MSKPKNIWQHFVEAKAGPGGVSFIDSENNIKLCSKEGLALIGDENTTNITSYDQFDGLKNTAKNWDDYMGAIINFHYS